MNRKRILATAKLVLLFGTPAALILGLFSCGVYCGVQNREGITRFEQNWLGFDVEVGEVPSGSDSAKGPTPSGEVPDPGSPTSVQPSPEPSPEPGPGPGPGSTDVTPTEPRPSQLPVESSPTGAVALPAEPGGVGRVPAPLAPIETRVDPLEEPDRSRLGIPKVVRVKVLVDQSFIDTGEDWISRVQRSVSRASPVFEEQFGIRLDLWAVGRWSVASQGMGAPDLLADLQLRPREGADILLGFTDREHDGSRVPGVGPEDPFNGAYAVVYANPRHRESHLRTLLHEITRLLGALEVTDSQSPEWKAGSWMSYAPVVESQAPWIDAENRRRVLEGKERPFAPPPTSAAPTSPAP